MFNVLGCQNKISDTDDFSVNYFLCWLSGLNKSGVCSAWAINMGYFGHQV